MSLPSSRIAGYDLARAIAFLGMVFINSKYMMEADQYGISWLLRLSSWLDGRPAVAFVILAGIGMSLLKTGSFRANSFHPFSKLYSTILKRAAFLFLLGLLFSFIWYADILHFYGVYFLVAIFAVNVSDRTLLTITGTVLVFSLFLAIHFNFEASPIIDSDLGPEFWTRKGFFKDLFVNGCYPVFPWIVYFLIGIWLGRKNLSDCQLQKKIILIAMLGIVLSDAFVWLVENLLITESNLDSLPLLIFLIDTSPFSPSILPIFSAGGTALLVIVLSMKLAKKAGPSKWLKPFLATAQMSLTLYIVHIGIFQLCMAIISQGECESALELAWIWAAIFCILAISFAYYWVNHFDRGPFEKIMRWVSR